MMFNDQWKIDALLVFVLIQTRKIRLSGEVISLFMEILRK